VAAALGGLALGMGWVASTVDVASPIEPEAAVAADGEGGEVVEFRLPGLDGSLLGPPDYSGQVVLVEFWATWCIPCRLQAQNLETLHEEFGDSVRFLAVNSGENEKKVRAYVEKTPFSYPVLLDPRDSLSAEYQILGLPTLMILDPQGRLVFRETGVVDPGVLRREIEAAGAA
jgi:thiol-disulfide isomerase/thioredoxin